MKGLLIDATRCIACGACSAACREKNGLPETGAADLSDRQFTVLKTVAAPAGEVTARRMCLHCLQPACVSACPVGALRKTAAGPVVYEESICMGCRYCMQACPYGVPRYEWQSLAPRVRKCSLCADRLAQGKPTACAEACPAGATVFGDRDELLREAQARIAAEPGKYVPKIYGERDGGGTSVMLLSPVAFEQFGLPGDVPESPLPMLTFAALSKIPGLVGVGSCVLTGLWWLTRRKEAVAREEAVQ